MGALRFLYDVVGIQPSVICGSSVGAINGAKLAEGDDAPAGRRAIDGLEAIWRGMRGNDDMWLAEPWLEKMRSQVAWATELRERAAEHGAAGSQARVVLRMVGEVVRRPPETDGTFDALRQGLRARSLLNNDPIRSMLERHLRPDLVAASGVAVRIGMVSLESGELRYWTETGSLLARDGSPLAEPTVGLVDATLASASIPVIFPPTRIGDEHYVDAGVREILPLDPAAQLLGSSGHVFGVVASAPGVEPMPDVGKRGLLDLARRVSSDIAPDETLHKELEPPRGWAGRVSVVTPEFDVHDVLTVDPALIAASLDYGYLRAADLLLGLDEEARALTTDITRARMRIRDAEGPVVGPFVSTEATELEPLERAGVIATETTELARLVARRRSLGAPVPPGGCAPVPTVLPSEEESSD